jgi:hypothetical protein
LGETYMADAHINLLEGYISDGYVLEHALVSDTKSGHTILEVVLVGNGKRITKKYRDDDLPGIKRFLLKKFPNTQILDK